LEIVERKIPEPAAGFVRIKIEACGICHRDAMSKRSTFTAGKGAAFCPKVSLHHQD
jgi:D-arabinose 1-dehydrogenase-like Zn-dependent alcohol dehydrogenase